MSSDAPAVLRRSGRSRLLSKVVASVSALVVTTGLMFGWSPPLPATAAVAPSFNPEMIITDALFYDSTSMSAAQIQTFLDAKIGTCLNGKCLNVATVPVATQAAVYSSRTGNLVCTSIPGGDRRVSELIYAVQVACGISAKVILVTLQKEQGLVTKTSPSDGALRAAMGMACPDTAPCDSAYAGLATQIIAGTRQLKTYKAGAFARQPGVNYIGYHPNPDCGGTSLNIRNYATAALYNYTPYQPNAAALANLGGTGDSCSSYGNRNFWHFYTSWFGSTGFIDGAAAIAEEYARTGGSTGPLGARLALRACPLGSSTCWQEYAGGMIGWSQSGGAWAMLPGAIYTAYLAAGGPGGTWGVPLSLENAIDAPSGNGRGQNFQNVQALSSSAGAFAVSTLVLSTYGQLGWVRGSLGWPVAAEVCSGSNCVQQFEGGLLGRVGITAFQLSAAVESKYLAAGGPTGAWGVPTSTENAIVSTLGTGFGQNFQKVQLLSSAAGMFAVPSALLPEYNRLGWVRGVMGWPASEATCTGTTCVQEFQGGALAVVAGQYFRVSAELFTGYQASGGAAGPWGAPTSAVSTLTTTRGTGLGQNFQQGQALSSPTGLFFVPSRILTTYSAAGWVRGALGWPTANAVCESSGACTQQFQGGAIAIPAGTGPGYLVDTGPIAVAHQASGGAAGPWGAPTSTVSTVTSTSGTGLGQNFQKGQALSSTAGVFFVPSRIQTAHAAAGWVRGALGWPTANAVCESSGACTQQFQGGAIAIPAGTGPGYVVDTGPIAVAHQASGGASGPWGASTSAVSTLTTTRGAGLGQNFQRGQALSSAAGVFFVPSRILTAYSAAGWVRGALGWPTANAVCETSGACTQQFQGGAIAIPAGTGPGYVVDTGPIAVAHQASGGSAGPWGAPTSSVSTLSTTRGAGLGQNFQQGQALSSTAGVFFVPSRILTAYAAAGWVRGALGWPTANAVCEASGACSQQFQSGAIAIPAGAGAATVTYR